MGAVKVTSTDTAYHCSDKRLEVNLLRILHVSQALHFLVSTYIHPTDSRASA